MRVKLRGLMAGPGGCFAAGSVVDVSDVVGKSLCETRQADHVDIEEFVVVEEKKPVKRKGKK